MTQTDPPAASLGELLASLPDLLIVPTGRLSVAESEQIVGLYAKAVDSPIPTTAELATERSARTAPATPPTPRPGDQGRAQAAKRFGAQTPQPTQERGTRP